MDLEDLVLEDVVQAPQALQAVGRLEQVLLLVEGQVEMGGDDVRDPVGGVLPQGGDDGIEVGVLVELQVFLEERQDPLQELLGVRRPVLGLLEDLGQDLVVRVGAEVLDDPGPALALDDDLHVLLVGLDRPDDLRRHPHGIDVLGAGVVDRGVHLGREEDHLVLLGGLLQGLDGRGPADDERHQGRREDDEVPEGDQRDVPDDFAVLGFWHGSRSDRRGEFLQPTGRWLRPSPG